MSSRFHLLRLICCRSVFGHTRPTSPHPVPSPKLGGSFEFYQHHIIKFRGHNFSNRDPACRVHPATSQNFQEHFVCLGFDYISILLRVKTLECECIISSLKFIKSAFCKSKPVVSTHGTNNIILQHATQLFSILFFLFICTYITFIAYARIFFFFYIYFVIFILSSIFTYDFQNDFRYLLFIFRYKSTLFATARYYAFVVH